MRRIDKLILLLVVVTLLSACKTAPPSSSKSGTTKEAYSEDLQRYRPQVPVEETEAKSADSSQVSESLPVISVMPVNETIDNLIDSIAVLQKSQNVINGYTILVHTGNNRDEALKARGQLLTIVSDVPSELVYQQPFFKVKLGRFTRQIQAESLLNQVKESFPSAIIIPDTFPVVTKKNE